MKNLKKLMEWAKTEEGKRLLGESFYETTKDIMKMAVLGIGISGLYLGLASLPSMSEKQNTFIDKSNKCIDGIKYVPRAGYFYCKTNKPYK